MKRSQSSALIAICLACLAAAPPVWAAANDDAAAAAAEALSGAAPPATSDEVGQLRHQLASQIDQCNALASSNRRTIENSDYELSVQKRRYSDLVQRYNKLHDENAEMSKRLKETTGAVNYNYQQSQSFKLGQDNAVSALASANQSASQMEGKLEALKEQLQAAQERNLQQALALANEQERSKALQGQNESLALQLAAANDVNAKQAASLAVAAVQPVAIGDQIRLPAEALFTSDAGGKASSQMLPKGTVVTVMGVPRGASGLYAVTLPQGTPGWISLR